MQSKEESETACAREDSLRLRLLPLFTTQVPQHPLSLSRLELLLYVFNYLQLLKFPFDYHSDTWLGQEQTALFVHLDPSFYTKGVTESTILVGCVVVMNVYVWVQVVVFLVGVEYSSWMVFARKVTFLLCLHVLLIPFLRIIIGYKFIYSGSFRRATSSRHPSKAYRFPSNWSSWRPIWSSGACWGYRPTSTSSSSPGPRSTQCSGKVPTLPWPSSSTLC